MCLLTPLFFELFSITTKAMLTKMSIYVNITQGPGDHYGMPSAKKRAGYFVRRGNRQSAKVTGTGFAWPANVSNWIHYVFLPAAEQIYTAIRQLECSGSRTSELKRQIVFFHLFVQLRAVNSQHSGGPGFIVTAFQQGVANGFFFRRGLNIF